MARLNCFDNYPELQKAFKTKVDKGINEALAAREVLIEMHKSMHKDLNEIRKAVGLKEETYVESSLKEANEIYKKVVSFVPSKKEVSTYKSSVGSIVYYTLDKEGEVVFEKGGNLKEMLVKAEEFLTKQVPDLTPEELKEGAEDLIKKQIKDSIPKKKPRSIFSKTTPAEEKEEPKKSEGIIKVETVSSEGKKESKLFTSSGKRSIFGRTPKRLELYSKPSIFEKENWTDLEKWLKDNFPNLPVYRVKNIIKATNGRQAWGMLHNGAIYLYENAQTGTAYHEVFEAIWAMATDVSERNEILKEFKNREGSFTDRFTGKVIKYSEATNEEAKEEIAEEFRDYVLEKKIPVKPKSGKPWLFKLFSDLRDLIKTFFLGPESATNTGKLFKKIGNGYYKTFIPYESNLSFAKTGFIEEDYAAGDENSVFRIIGLPYTQQHELMQEMTYSTLAEIVGNNDSLFNIGEINKTILYQKLKEEILSRDLESPGILYNGFLKLDEDFKNGKISTDSYNKDLEKLEVLYSVVDNNWDKIVEEHAIYLKQYSIEFDENDNISLNREEETKENQYENARKTDSFRKANPAIKLLLATLPIVEYFNGEYSVKPNTIGGVSTIPLDKAFITLKNRLYDSLDIKDMMAELRDLALEDPNYRVLYTRLTKNSPDDKKTSEDREISFTRLTEKHDIDLLSAFYKAMKAQNADVKIVYILPSGEIEIGDAHLANATRQLKSEMFSELVNSLKGGHKYLDFNKKDRTYEASKLVKSVKLDPSKPDTYISFLKELGIEFTKKEWTTLEKKGQIGLFKKATEGTLAGIQALSEIKDINKYTIGQEKTLRQLGALKASLTNPDFESTYFNISGERTQTYIGTNVISDFFQTISSISNLNKEIKNTPYKWLLTDTFAQGSLVLNSLFNPKTGNKREGKEDILSVGIVEGIVEEAKGKSTESSNFTSKQRLIQDLNNNYNGWFMNLVPGDASIEWMIKLFSNGNPFVKASDLQNGYTDENIFNIFKDYFIAEVNTSRGDRPIVDVKGRSPKDLRFFKGILNDEKLHKSITSNTTDTAEKIYNNNNKAIKTAVKKFIESKANERLAELHSFNILKTTDEGMQLEGLEFGQKEITPEKLDYELQALEANFIIANIEMHKLIYSDPYFYKDELKRTKNFGSPAQPLMNNPEINAVSHKIFNKSFKKGQAGWTDFTKNYLISATIDDVKSFIKDLKGYESWEETDGGGIITEQANRVVRIKAANWNDSNEAQFVHDMKYYEMYKSGASVKELYEFDDKNNPGIKSTYTPIKPIVRGSKDDGNPYNDVVLDKFALTPFSFRILHRLNPKSNAIKHYQRMLDTEVDYTVFGSGRKVGAVYPNPLYEPDGSYATAPFLGTSNIPYSIMSIQTEVPSKDKPEVTQGSQITTLATMDFMDAGVPIDFMPEESSIEKRISAWELVKDKEKASPLYKLIKHNETLLVERIKTGYATLLDKLGIEYTTINGKKVFSIKDKQKLIDTLTSEIYKREVNDNIVEAFKGFKEGAVVLEATPAYQQIRNILYSIANKQVTRSSISGGMKVQVQSTLLESVKAKEEKGKYVSDTLDFYSTEVDENGKITKVNVCEIMVGRWFKSDKTDAELLKYLNDTKEGQKILRGVAYRIPTQKQNSIDVFKIKQFLPNEFGDSVIIPSALVKKVGSDFDIDKLSIYFKNIYEDLKGNIKLIPFLGYGEKAKAQLSEMYNEGEFLSKETKELVHKYIKNRKKEDLKVFSSVNRDEVTERLFDNMFGGNQFEDSYIVEVLDDILESESEQKLRDKIVDIIYKKSLENEYIQSLEDLTSHPLNYERLITPNSAEQLKDLSKEIVKKITPGKEIDYTSVGNMLDRSFMERLRQAFVKGKYAIGIAATAQTNNAKNQRSNIIVDIDKLDSQSKDDKKWLGDGIIKFDEFNKVNGKPSLSLAKNSAGQLISDIIGQFIDGYVDISKGPWIMELGATPNTAGTWLFLVKLGVPVRTVAYFMNQPIIKDHIKNLENSGYSYIFNSTSANQIEEIYDSKVAINIEKLPSFSDLEKMIGKKPEDMSEREKALQGFIFQEFFKYAKLAEQLFHVQQGSNFDTANINDPFIVFKKRMQYEKAKTMMISSVDDLLNNSFVWALKDTIFDIRDAFSTILISDKGAVRNVLEKVLLPYIDTPDRDFVKTSQKAVNDLFDWAMQTNEGFNAKIKSILLGSDDKASAAQEIMSFVSEVKKDKDHPLNGNYIINSLRQERSSVKENKPHNLYITGKNNKTYDQNSAVYGFSEIRDYLKNQDNLALYEKLVALSVLQSGLSNSKISFTQLLPYEDFRDVYNPALQNLEKISNLQQFADLDIFQRNNWNNTDIVYGSRSKTIKSKKGNWVSNMPMIFVDKKLQKEIKNGKLPQIIQFSPFTPEGNKNFISYTWELDEELLRPNERFEDYKVKKAIAWARKKDMKKRGDYSYIKRGLFKKVLDANGNPVIYESTYEDKVYTSYLFRAINAWGDSFRANEFYSLPRPSVIDNSFIKVEESIQQPGTQNPTDTMIEKTLNAGIIEKKENKEFYNLVSGGVDVSTKKTINIYAGTNENADLSNFANRPLTDPLGVPFKNVEAAFQYAKTNFSKENNDEIRMKLQTASGSEAKALGQKIKGLNVKDWDKASSLIMKSILKDSFEQNPAALKKLLDTGNAELTHTQDKGKWGTEFPKLLMEVREELKKGTTKLPDCH